MHAGHNIRQAIAIICNHNAPAQCDRSYARVCSHITIWIVYNPHNFGQHFKFVSSQILSPFGSRPITAFR